MAVKGFQVDGGNDNLDFESSELTIQKLEGETGNNGCDFKEVNIPKDVVARWFQGRLCRFSMTVTLIFDDKAVDDLNLAYYLRGNLVNTNKEMLTDAINTDLVIVAANGVEVACHKSFLSVSSDVFKAMFQSKMKEETNNRLDMPKLSESGVRALLAFIYSLEIEGASSACDTALELLRAGHMYNVKKLHEAMKKLICAKRNEWFGVDMAVGLCLFARKLDDEFDKDKDKLLAKAVGVLKWYNNASSNNLMTSEEYEKSCKDDPKAAMELGSLFLKYA